MQKNKKNYFKYTIGFIFCFLFRLLPFRPPNIEPLLFAQMPFSKNYGNLAGFFFGFLSIILYDVVTQKIGVWTLVTATVYGTLGLFASMYFKNKENKSWNYGKFAIIATIAYDALTGLTVGPIFFHQSFMNSLIGQIPFTLLHLAGNVTFSLLLSPMIYTIVNQDKKIKLPLAGLVLSPKQI